MAEISVTLFPLDAGMHFGLDVKRLNLLCIICAAADSPCSSNIWLFTYSLYMVLTNTNRSHQFEVVNYVSTSSCTGWNYYKDESIVTYKQNVSLNFGDQLFDFDFVECLRFLSLRCGPIRCTSMNGRNILVVCHLRSLAATTESK